MIESLIGAGLATVGGLIGQLISGKDREEAEALLQGMRDQYGRIDPAKVKQMAVEQLGPSALKELEYGPEASAMQDSLNRYGQGIEQGGMSVGDRAALNEALDAAGQQERAQRAALLRQYQGTGSQGLLAGLMAQQGGAQNAYRSAQNAAAQAQQRYWQMIQGRAGLANQMYGNRAKTAEAQDAINRWNATNRQDTQRYNNSLEQQRYENDMHRLGAQQGIAQQQAALKGQQADRTQQMWGQLGGAAAGAANQYGADQDYQNYLNAKRRRDSAPDFTPGDLMSY